MFLSELASLSKEQRESLAGFILTFPKSPEINIASLSGVAERLSEFVASEPNPADVFPITSVPAPAKEISTLGPQLVIPPAPPSPKMDGLVTDKSGLPWDERIHASSKAMNADGTWRAKRGVADTLVQEVEAQLRKVLSIPSPPIAEVPIPPAPDVKPSIPVISSAPPAPPADDKAAFIGLITKLSSAKVGGKITEAEITSILGSLGIESLPLLGHRLDLVPQVTTLVDATLTGR